MAMMPTTTSVTKSRWRPSVKSMPRLPTPRRAATLTNEMLLTDTTRSPANRTGRESGRSTCRNRASGLKPMACAAWLMSASTESKASRAARTSKATA